MLNKVLSEVVVIIKGEFVGVAEDFDNAKELIETFIMENVNHEKENLEDLDIQLFNTVSKLDNTDLNIKAIAGDLNLDDMNPSNSEEITYEIIDGHGQGREFDDEESLRDWLKKEYEGGYIDLDDMKSIEIMEKKTISVYFDNASQEDSTYEITTSNGLAGNISSYFGSEFVLAVDAETAIEGVSNLTIPTFEDFKPQVDEEIKRQLSQANIVDLNTLTDYMTEEELQNEMQALQKRLLQLNLEQASRRNQRNPHQLGEVKMLGEV